MFQQLLHLMGLCPDHLMHINFLDAPWQDLMHFFNSIKSFFKKY